MLRHSLLLLSRGSRGRSYLGPRLTVRLLSHSVTLDPNDYTSALYSKLSLQDQYQFLDRTQSPSHLAGQDEQLAASVAFHDFLNILAEEKEVGKENLADFARIQKEFCAKFTSWTKMSQLRVGFLMYLDTRIEADDYLRKVIKHMGSVNFFDASTHDMTALLLLIYFKRDMSVEDLSEYMDPSLLMSALAVKLRNKEMSRDEVCACCLGLKRVSGLSVTTESLRKELYDLLATFTAGNSSPQHLDDFFVVTLMTTLARGNLIFKDDLEVVNRMMVQMHWSIHELRLDTAIKVMCYPLTLHFTNREMEDAVLPRALSQLATLNTRDLLSLSNYISKSLQPGVSSHIPALVSHLEGMLAGLEGVKELVDVLQCFHYIAHRHHYSETFSEAVFAALANVPLLEKGFDVKQVSLAIARDLGHHLGLHTEHFTLTAKEAAIFLRITAFLCFSYQVDYGQTVTSVNPSVLFSLSSHSHKQLPMHIYSPMMEPRKLDRRTTELVKVYRCMCRFMGTEEYCRVVRILPHFDEPDIVFGNIGGNCLTVPPYMWQPGLLGVRKPPPGDWHVLVIGTRKSLDINGQVVGQEAAKLSQLEKLGYIPIILPYKDLSNYGSIMAALGKVMKTADVTLPNLDDGIHQKTRKF